MSDLLPCPFCGGKTISFAVGETIDVICQNCSTTIPCCDTEEEAIGRWNTRYKPTKSEDADE